MQPRIEKTWNIADPIPAGVDAALGDYPPFLRQILYNRGVHTNDEARRFLQSPLEPGDPFLLSDMGAAVERLEAAVRAGERVAVYGDYDVDGVTATALLVQVLRALGADVQEYIPNRFDEGYGLNNEALEALAAAGVQLVVTVDCGIRSAAEAQRARQLGMEMIITDHHHPLAELPEARAVICPKRADDGYPDKNLAGVGLAYKLAQALVGRFPQDGLAAEDWLDLVALGTVADVVPLVGENRMLVRAGLARLRYGQRQGLLSLVGAAGLTASRLTATDIGFGLGPRLNAAGRLETALDSFRLLMAHDVQTAGLLAQKLDDQNRQRQVMTAQMQTMAETLMGDGGQGQLLFATHPDFNSGVVGLVAARLTESYYRPSIVGQQGEEFTRASCRSIPEFHITRALDECKDLLERHGGHAMAAGLTVRNERVGELAERLKAIAERELGGRDLRPQIRADLEVSLAQLRPDWLNYLDQLQPTGVDNPEAAFVSRGVRVTRHRTVGSEGNHLRLTLLDGGITYDGIAFRQGHWAGRMPGRVDILYHFERNYYQGQVSLQLNIRDLRPTV